MALAAVERGHTRIDVLLFRLPKKVQAILNLISYIALGIGAAFMGYMGWYTLDESLTLDQFPRVRFRYLYGYLNHFGWLAL